jgi:hypothetical protein
VALDVHRLERAATVLSTLLQGQLDAFDQQIMDFAPLVEGDLPQRRSFKNKRPR